MKKTLTVLAGLFIVLLINAQSLEEIVKRSSKANKHDRLAAMNTLKITAKMSMMGMEMPMEMWLKKPDKIKTVSTIAGQQMIAVFDGTKGYILNPMAGSAPVEMTADQIKDTQRSNLFKNQVEEYLKEGKLTLIGEESVNSRPTHKIKAALDGGNTAFMFIDKDTYLMIKMTATINQGGMTITADSYPTDYKEIKGIMLPMKTTTTAQGMEMTLVYENVEVDIPMDDSVFTIK